MDLLLSRLTQIRLISSEIDFKKKEDKKDKKEEKKDKKKDKEKEKEKEEKKVIEIDPEILTVSTYGAILKCSSSFFGSTLEESLQSVLKQKDNILIGDDFR